MPLGNLQHGYPDYVGKRFIWAAPYIGPASYVTGGETVSFPRFNNYIDSVNDALSVSGTYLMRGIPSAPNLAPNASGFARATWKVKVFVVATGAEVAAATNLSAESFQATGFGGVY